VEPTDEVKAPASDDPQDLVPSEDGSEEDAGDESLLVIRIQERQLMWIVIAILGIFVVIEGIAILGLRSAVRGQSYGGPISRHVDEAPGEPGTWSGTTQSEPGRISTAPGQEGGDPPAGEGVSEEFATGPAPVMLVSGEEAISRTKAFAKEIELDVPTTDALIEVIEKSNVAIDALDAQIAAGEIELDAYMSEVQRTQSDLRLEILRIIGWQKSSDLYERLLVTEAEAPEAAPPPPAEPPAEPPAK